MRKWPSGWYLLVWVIFGFLAVLSGVISGNIAAIIIGTVLAYGTMSAYLTFYVKTEQRLKKTLEVVSAIVTLVIVVSGYVTTESFILGIMTLFIAIVVFLLSQFPIFCLESVANLRFIAKSKKREG